MCARFYVKIRVQRGLSIDDGILAFGVSCLIASTGIFLASVDKLYLLAAFQSGVRGLKIPNDFLQQVFVLEKLLIFTTVLLWCCIVAVKLSYLLLFKRLIDRLRPFITYWWFVVAFNGIPSIYGVVLPFVICPSFASSKTCGSPVSSPTGDFDYMTNLRQSNACPERT